MKKFVLWLARVFKVDITVEKVIIKEVPVKVAVEKLVALQGIIKDDVTVKGNLIVEGTIEVSGDVTCFKL